jgi:hypothetical protein
VRACASLLPSLFSSSSFELGRAYSSGADVLMRWEESWQSVGDHSVNKSQQTRSGSSGIVPDPGSFLPSGDHAHWPTLGDRPTDQAMCSRIRMSYRRLPWYGGGARGRVDDSSSGRSCRSPEAGRWGQYRRPSIDLSLSVFRQRPENSTTSVSKVR